MESGLDAEMDEQLGYDRYDVQGKETDDSRNGHSRKTLRTSFGDATIQVPRDRKGEFDPTILRKNQTSISQDVEAKIISMYAKGMSTTDIGDHIRDIYGIEVSESTVSRITDKVLPEAREWQQRPLESVYAVMFMDAIHYHVRSEGQIVKKAVYIAIGIDLSGRKDVLGMWVGENESAKYWVTVLNSLRNRGVEDVFIACTDNLTGFANAIEAVFPKADIQNCIIHQLRNYGQKVWHSNDPYRRVIWRCNKKYVKGQQRCGTPTFDEETIKALFLKAYNQLMADRDSVAEDCRTLADMLGDTTAFDEKIAAAQKEIEDVVSQNSAYIHSHNATGENMEEFRKQTAEYDERYRKADARMNRLRTERQERLARSQAVRGFAVALIDQPQILTQWQDCLWNLLMQKMVVQTDGTVEFTFKGENKITVRAD